MASQDAPVVTEPAGPQGPAKPSAEAAALWNDRVVPRRDHPVRLPMFEGPLDLLLFLVRRQEVDLFDISLHTLIKDYLEALRSMREERLAIAGEFFVMAATLMQLKSRWLLPRPRDEAADPEDEEQGQDPRWELLSQLLTYQKVKDAARGLQQRIDLAGQLLFREVSEPPPKPERGLAQVDVLDLWQSFQFVLTQLREKLELGKLHEDTYTVADRLSVLRERLETQPTLRFEELLPPGPCSIHLVVTTFFALLEMVRLGRVRAEQDTPTGAILLHRIETPSEGADTTVQNDVPAALE